MGETPSADPLTGRVSVPWLFLLLEPLEIPVLGAVQTFRSPEPGTELPAFSKWEKGGRIVPALQLWVLVEILRAKHIKIPLGSN